MTGRFSERVEAALIDAGWQPGRSVTEQTAEAIRLTCADVGRNGERHQPFPAVVRMLDEFGGLGLKADREGGDYLPRPFAIDPTMASGSAETLADFGRLLGLPLFPVGTEGRYESIIAMDERGRLFALDHTGEYFLGDSFEEAMETLVMGTHAIRVRDDGSWSVPAA